MLKKLRRRVKTLITTKVLKKPNKTHKPQTPEQQQQQQPPQTMTSHNKRPHKNTPFLFPRAQSTVLPDPSGFFAPGLLSGPKPTNSFFQNFVLKNGDQPEYIHPYLIRSADSSLTVCYPTRFSNPAFIYQVFNADISISASPETQPPRGLAKNHVVSAFDGLSVTLDVPSANLRAFLVRGSPYVTCSVDNGRVAISTVHAVLSLAPDESRTKHALRLNNGQAWVVYSSSPVELRLETVSRVCSVGGFSGVLRVAAVPDPGSEAVLDRFSPCYPVSGDASFDRSSCLEYKWEKRGWGDLLMLAHPLHLKLLEDDDCCHVTVLDGFRYSSIDGDLVGVVGDSWTLKPDPVPITWHSTKGLREDSKPEIASALRRDVDALDVAAIATTSSYFYGKLVSRAARLALIAEEACLPEAVPRVAEFLRRAVTPWLDGTFAGNGFLHDERWGGIVTRQGLSDGGADFGFGVYNDHHYHLGYFLYAAAVLAKIDPAWGRRFRPQAYAMVADIMTMGTGPGSACTRLRCFDLYKLHSWAGGLTEFADGRNQESSSEAVHAYYAAALLGLAYGDARLASAGSALASLEISAAATWWHIKGGEGPGIYEAEFSGANRVVGVVWANKRDSGLWFAPPEWRECRLGIQVLPLTPATEALFADSRFTRELVDWAEPALGRPGVGEGWKGFVYALQGVYDRDAALAKIRALGGFDDGDSLSNLLWWVHSRTGEDGDDEGCDGKDSGGKHGWFARYFH